MKIISFEDIKKLNIPPNLCYQWVTEALFEKEKAILPHKISLKPMDGVFYNTMPVLIPFADGGGYGGVKLVTRYPDRVPSLESQLLLYDLASGENLALMDATWITAMRTGAVAVNSLLLFAVENFSILSFIGLGNTARATLLILLSVLSKERKLTIKLKKYKDQHLNFANRFKEYSNIKFEFFDTYEQTVENSDVVVSAATYFDQDIVDQKYFKKGCLLIPIHTRGFTSCDITFDKVFADDKEHVSGFKYFDKFKSFSEVNSVILGKSAGRENNEERILAYNIGIALHDIFFASKIYQLINGAGKEISLASPKEKFWI